MTKALLTALTFGFLASTLSVLPISTAQAECQDLGPSYVPICPQGYVESNRALVSPAGKTSLWRYTCCTNPSEPYATGETAEERAARFQKEAAEIEARKADCEAQGKRYDPGSASCKRPIKSMGKDSPTGKAALKYACNAQNWVWNDKTGRCKKPSAAKAECEARGPAYHYDLDTQGCVGGMLKKKKSTSERAEECEARGPKFRYDVDTGRCIKTVSMSKENLSEEESDDDYRPKKKKRYHDDDWEGGRIILEGLSPFFERGGPPE